MSSIWWHFRPWMHKKLSFSQLSLQPVTNSSSWWHFRWHYNGVIMNAMASQITSLTIVYSTVYSRPRSKKISKLRVTGLCAGNSPVTGEFPTQRTRNAENVSTWWHHHVILNPILLGTIGVTHRPMQETYFYPKWHSFSYCPRTGVWDSGSQFMCLGLYQDEIDNKMQNVSKLKVYKRTKQMCGFLIYVSSIVFYQFIILVQVITHLQLLQINRICKNAEFFLSISFNEMKLQECAYLNGITWTKIWNFVLTELHLRIPDRSLKILF